MNEIHCLENIRMGRPKNEVESLDVIFDKKWQEHNSYDKNSEVLYCAIRCNQSPLNLTVRFCDKKSCEIDILSSDSTFICYMKQFALKHHFEAIHDTLILYDLGYVNIHNDIQESILFKKSEVVYMAKYK